MKMNILHRILVAAVIGAVSLLGVSIPANADPQPKQNQKQQKKQKKGQPRAQQQQKVQQEQQALLQNQGRPPGWDKGKKVGWGNSSVPPGQQGRLSQQRQNELIALQRQRLTQYRQYLDRFHNACAIRR